MQRTSPFLALLLLAPSLVGLVGVDAQAKSNPFQCQTYASPVLGKSARYCIFRSHPETPPEPGETVVYLFHGINGDARSFDAEGYVEGVRVLASIDHFPPVTFVSMDTEPASFFSDIGGKPQGKHSYESWFIHELMPKVESENALCRDRSCRAVAGYSMGGFGALKLGLRHPDLFGTIAANSPALPPFSIYEDRRAWWDFFGQHPIGSQAGVILLERARQVFPNEALYEESNPLQLVENFTPGTFPQLYFDMGGQDTYGFEVGFHILSAKLQSLGLPAEERFYPDLGHSIMHLTRWPLLKFLRRALSAPVQYNAKR